MGRGDISDSQLQSVCEKLFACDAFLNKIVDSIVSKVFAKLEERFNVVSEKVDSMEVILTKMEGKLDFLEQNARSHNLLVGGLSTNDPNQIKVAVVKMCKDNLHLQVSTDDIEFCRNIPCKNRSHSSCVVKFCSKSLRDNIFRNKSMLKGTKFTVREDLTQNRYKLLLEAGKSLGKLNVWSIDGRVLAKYKGKIINISKLDDLKEL